MRRQKNHLVGCPHLDIEDSFKKIGTVPVWAASFFFKCWQESYQEVVWITANADHTKNFASPRYLAAVWICAEKLVRMACPAPPCYARAKRGRPKASPKIWRGCFSVSSWVLGSACSKIIDFFHVTTRLISRCVYCCTGLTGDQQVCVHGISDSGWLHVINGSQLQKPRVIVLPTFFKLTASNLFFCVKTASILSFLFLRKDCI